MRIAIAALRLRSGILSKSKDAILCHRSRASDPPKYRPLERFWPYADLPEQPTDEELAALDPDLHEALFGAQPRPFSITLVFPDARRARLRARARARARVGRVPRDRQRAPRAAIARGSGRATPRSLRDLFEIVGALGRHRSADRRSAGARTRASCGCRSSGSSFPGSAPCRPVDIERDLQRLEAELKQLEAEYNMFFAGPAAEAAVGNARPRRGAGQAVRSRATSRTPAIASASARCSRGSRRSSISGIAGCARGRKGGRARSRRSAPTSREEPKRPEDRILHVAAFRDPVREIDKLHGALRIARRSAARGRRGRGAVPQVRRAGEEPGEEAARQPAAPEVAFRVAVKDGKVNFTARALKGVEGVASWANG